MKKIAHLFPFCIILLCLSCQSEAPKVLGPKIDFSSLSEEAQHEAKNALASMTLAAGLEATLFASEPTLTNPTNINVDEKGRVWAIEAINYRNQHNTKNPYRNEGDRILILEDKDGDGKADDTKVFYQGEDINSALGIWVMGNKVIVSSSPNVFLFTDTDGDDKADDKKVLFSKIDGVDHDHGAHAFIFGPDGRLYFNMGNEGQQLANAEGKSIIDVHGKEIKTGDKNFRQGLAMRCEVDGSKVEVVGHNFRNNFELVVDSYGTIWQSDNDDDGNKATRINFLMEYGNYGFTDEITGAGWRARRVGMHEEIPKRHWHLNDPGVVPNLLQTGSGSPTGMVFYEGDLLPEVFRQQMIHCEPGHQVVRAYPTQKSGAGYTAEIVNVMKSVDKWFRPSDVCVAPDGSLFVSDWYDPGVGGHKMGDPDRGRIYRIAPKGKKYTVPSFDLSSPAAAAAALASPNLSTRYLAWTKLHESAAEAETALKGLWNGEDQAMRARALWLLARIPGKTGDYLQTAIKDNNPDIRITGLRAARQLDKDNIVSYLQGLQNDATAGVRREVAVALRHFPDEAVGGDIWVTLAKQYDGQDRWYLEALGIAADPHAEAYFKKWKAVTGDNWNTPQGRNIIWRSRSKEALPLLAKMIADPDVGEADLQRFFRAYHFNSSPKKNELLASLLEIDHPRKNQVGAYALGQIEASYLRNSPKLQKSVNRILPAIEGTPEWISAVKSLGLRNQNPGLMTLFLTHEDRSLAVEAAQTLLKLGGAQYIQNAMKNSSDEELKELIYRLGWIRSGEEAPKILMASLEQSKHALPIKRLIVESLGNSYDGQHLLFDKLEANQLEESLVTTAALKLMYCWDPKVRNNAPKYLQTGNSENPLPSISELTEAKGNIAAGKKVFSTYCATCHQVKGEGINYGPDLSEIGSKLARSAMYSSIIFPSAGINFGYEGYEIKLKDNTIYNGYIESETEDEISLRMMGGISQNIQKKDIVKKEEMQQSLMLEGLTNAMGQESLVDLVEYLASLKTAELLSSN